MKALEGKVSRQTIQRLLTARLLVRVQRTMSRDDIVRSVARAISPPCTAAEAHDAVRRELTQCEKSGLIRSVAPSGRKPSKRRREPRPSLTAKGRNLAASWLGEKRSIRNWEHARQLVALSLIGRVAIAEKVLRVDELAAAILAERQRIPGPASKLAAVIDRLAWRKLGVDTAAPFDMGAVQRYLLRELVPADVRVGRATWRRMVVMRAAGADGHDTESLLRALFAQPKPARETTSSDEKQAKPAAHVAKQRAKAARSSANDNASRRVQQPSLADFAAAVRAAALMPNVVRFHDDRAFIGSIWKCMHEAGQVRGMSLADFKTRLIAAHRDGLIRITRADLVGAMDPDEVERSEARYQDATFHFVAIEAGGGR